jgi:hypothetical protein
MYLYSSRLAGGAFFEPLESRQLRSASTLEYVEMTDESAELPAAIEMPLETEDAFVEAERLALDNAEPLVASTLEYSDIDWANMDPLEAQTLLSEMGWDTEESDPESDQPLEHDDYIMPGNVVLFGADLGDPVFGCWDTSRLEILVNSEPTESETVRADAEQVPADPAPEAADASLDSTDAYEQIAEDSGNPDLFEDASDMI